MVGQAVSVGGVEQHLDVKTGFLVGPIPEQDRERLDHGDASGSPMSRFLRPSRDLRAYLAADPGNPWINGRAS